MKIMPALFALGTAICWGLYGPVLANARSIKSPPEWSPFKPYVFIGLAYVVWAIGGGLMGMRAKSDSYSFLGGQSPAMIWGFLAGTLGALGALSLTNAMLSGGKPLFVMPIVFGGAVSVMALVSVVRLKEPVSPFLWIGMAAVVIGIVLVAYNTPHGHAPKPASGPDAHAAKSVESTSSSLPGETS